MFNKLTLNELLITVIPGGFVVSVLVLSLGASNPQFISTLPQQDFFLSFIFLAVSITAGEVIQTIAHMLEPAIDLFFKGYRPSEVFLLPNNPIISNDRRTKIIKHLSLTEAEQKKLDDYNSIWLRTCCKCQFAQVCQGAFNRLYADCNENNKIKQGNSRYLFVRGMFCVFLLVGIWFWHLGINELSVASLILSIIFLYRARGCAKGLVRDVSYSFSKK